LALEDLGYMMEQLASQHRLGIERTQRTVGLRSEGL